MFPAQHITKSLILCAALHVEAKSLFGTQESPALEIIHDGERAAHGGRGYSGSLASDRSSAKNNRGFSPQTACIWRRRRDDKTGTGALRERT